MKQCRLKILKNVITIMLETRKIKCICFIFVALIGLFSVAAQAKSLSTLGAVFPICEISLLDTIKSNIESFIQKHGRDALQVDAQSKQAIDRPMPVAGLSRTQTPRVWLFDPSITVSQAIQDPWGRVVFPVGQTINPLESVSLPGALLFYDADDEKQVRWAQEIDRALQGNTFLILMKGSIKDQTQRFGKAVYFDQGGLLKERFQLQHVPTLITQEDKKLKIQEVALS